MDSGDRHPMLKRFPWMLALGLSTAAVAADDDLYDPAPPPGSAFVRVVHAAPGASTVAADLDGVDQPGLALGTATPYLAVQRGPRTVRVGERAQADVQVTAGAWYTVVLTGTGDRVQVLQDPTNTNMAKALLVLYNLTETPGAVLKTADGTLEVIPAVASMGSGDRAVNPLKVDLAVHLGERQLQVFLAVELSEGLGYSVVVIGAAGQEQAVLLTNETRVGK